MSTQEKTYPVPERLQEASDLPTPFISSFDEYKELWQESIDNSSEFFAKASCL
jgi:acetyl-CoA synthetase